MNYSMMTSIMAPMMLITLSKMMKMKKNKEKNKSLPFECGFSNPNKMMIPMSLQFTLITIMFLIFDIEICILLTLTKTSKLMNNMNWTPSSMVFFIMMMMSLIIEWMNMAMKWNQ